MVEVQSVQDALGAQASGVRRALIDVVRSVHSNFAAAHQRSESKFGMGFGSQWRDLLVASNEVLTGRGCDSHKLMPGGYSVPVVHDCLVYVWRMPDSAKPEAFASSRTKRNGFAASPPPPTLFPPGFLDEPEEVAHANEVPRPAQVLREAGAVMPMVLVIIRSSPWQLQSIDWAVAELDGRTGEVSLHAEERIWEPELVAADVASEGEPFDAGVPVPPTVEPREAESAEPDA